MSEAADLQPPLLLLAMPQVLDPFFHKSVVLLVHHQDEGSLGFIVNRPTGVKITDILEDLEIEWLGEKGTMAFFGGPVEPQIGTLIYQPDETSPPGRHEVCEGVALTQHVGDLETLAVQPPGSFRLLLGYAGWGDGQLEQELLRNDWLIAPVNDDILFHDDPEEVWRMACQSVGINPDQLPSWTSNDGDGAAN